MKDEEESRRREEENGCWGFRPWVRLVQWRRGGHSEGAWWLLTRCRGEVCGCLVVSRDADGGEKELG